MSDKLTKFTKAILEDAESVSRGILDGIARERTAALKEVEEQTLAETFSYVKGEVARIRVREGKRLSKAVLDAKRSYFIRRNEITDEVFDALKARIEAFTQTHDYDKKLISFARSVSAQVGVGNLVVYLRAADMGMQNILAPVFGLGETQFREGDFEYGGLVAECPEKHMRIDYTFDAAIEDKYHHFNELFALGTLEE